MKLKEKQAFKLIEYILKYLDMKDILPKDEIADFVMTDLINLELGDK